MFFGTPHHSPLSRLHTLTKLVIALFFSVFIVFMTSEPALLLLFACSFLYVAPAHRLKLLLVLYVLIAAMFGLSLLFSYPLAAFLSSPGEGSEFFMIVPFLRIGVMINLSCALLFSTSARNFVNVLKTLRIPRFIFLPVAVMFRFVPQYVNEVKLIHESIRIRVGRFNAWTMIRRPRLFLRCVMMPSVIRALRAAEELAAAAEMKGVGESRRMTVSRPEPYRFRDALALVIAGEAAYITLIVNVLYA